MTPLQDKNEKNDNDMATSKELVRLASAPGVSCKRGPDNVFTDWHTWASQHPEREHKVHVYHGREEWKNKLHGSDGVHNDKLVSVISWNVLSPTHYTPEAYPETANKDGHWEFRFPRLLQWMETLQPDILALQEVDFDRFDSEWRCEMNRRGYDGRMQSRKKPDPNQPCGCATFWRKDKFRVSMDPQTQTEQIKSGSRSMVARLQMIQPRIEQQGDPLRYVTLINVHLEATQRIEGFRRRAEQLDSSLERAKRLGGTGPVVLAGDFNTGCDSELFRVLRTHSWHGHELAHSYEHPETFTSVPVCRETHCTPGAHYKIDHALHSHKYLQLHGVLSAFTPEEVERHLGTGKDRGFPDSLCPSDHVPVGALFEFANTKDDVPVELDENTKERMREQWKAILDGKPNLKSKPKTTQEMNERKAYAKRVKDWKASFEDSSLEFGFALKLANGSIP